MICASMPWISPNLIRLEETQWRTGWDSNPRYGFPYAGFQDQSLKPLGHLSLPELAVNCLPGTALLREAPSLCKI